MDDERGKAALISELSTSASFAETHRIVAALSQYADFSNQQAIEIVECSFTNGQVHSIATDRDVSEFLESVTDGREEIFNFELLDRLFKGLPVLNDDEFDEIPF